MRALVKLLPLWALLSGLERGDGQGGSAELAALLTQQKGLSSDEMQQRVQVLMQESKHQSDLHSATHNASSWTNVELGPNGKIKPLAKLSGRMYFNHIAKCSGGSAIEQIKDIVKNAEKNADQAMVFEGREECYGYTRLSRFGPGKAKVDHYLTMLRSPRHQVVSQFFMLKNFGQWCNLNPEESGAAPGTRCCSNFPKTALDLEALRLWLDWYASADWRPNQLNTSTVSLKVGNYLGSCYTPWNMQSRALTCTRLRPSYTRALNWDEAAPPPSVALNNLNTFSWVGITELFDESICLFEYRVTGVLSPKCECTHKWKSDSPHTSSVHTTGGSSFENLPDPKFEAKVDKITRVDAQLYRAALVRTVRELRALEKETGQQVLCSGKLALVRESTKYIPGVWNVDLAGESAHLKRWANKLTDIVTGKLASLPPASQTNRRERGSAEKIATVEKVSMPSEKNSRAWPLRRLNRNIFMVHIAKCSGGSAGVQIGAAVKAWASSRRPFGRDSFDLNEECYGYAKSTRKNVDHYLTMLRSPRAQVISAFFMLKNFGGWCILNPSESGLKKGTKCCKNFPRGSDVDVLSTWLKFYAHGQWSPDSNDNTTTKHKGNFLGSCYTPWNMQSRALTCGGKRCHLAKGESFSANLCSAPQATAGLRDGWMGALSHRAHDWKEAVPLLDDALEQLGSFSWVGITELFDESMCIFKYRLTNKLPESCTCKKPHSSASIVISTMGLFGNNTTALHERRLRETKLHASGGAAFENFNDPIFKALIDNITRVDGQLYRAGLVRMVKEIRLLEARTGHTILCPSKLANVIEETEYIAGLWDLDLKHEVDALKSGVAQFNADNEVLMEAITKLHPQKKTKKPTSLIEYSPTVIVEMREGNEARDAHNLRPLSGKMFFTHIAKAAGGSAMKELNGIVKGHIVHHQYEPFLKGEEECYGHTRMHRVSKYGNLEEFDHYLTMLRSPRAQVVSQFFMLKGFGAWCTLDPGESGLEEGTRCCDNFPKLQNFEMLNEWVNWFTGSDWTPDHRNTSAAKVGNYLGSCYTPWNMQSRALTCGSTSIAHTYSTTTYHRASDWVGCSPPLDTVLHNLETFSWVGIAELFSESLCLFQYRAKGSLPAACVCDSNAIKIHGPWLPVPLVTGAKARHTTGGSRYENIRNLEFEAKVDQMTRVDGQLYRAGVVRLVRELRALEGATGSAVLCASAMNKLKSETDYIPGLWDLDLAAEVVKMNKAPPPFKHTRSKSVNNSSEFMAKRGVNQTSIALRRQ